MTSAISLPLPGGATRNFLDVNTADDERIALVEKLSSGEMKTHWTLRGLDNHLLRTWTDNTSNGAHAWAWVEDEVFAGSSPLAYVSSIGVRHYGVDHLGSTVVVTDSNGHLVGNINYDAFGAGGATGAGMLQYTGHERDGANAGPQTGTVRLPDYLHARNYDPLRGRFLSIDPEISAAPTMHRPQKWNRYAYVVNNPVLYLDPTGKQEAAGFAMDRDVQDLLAHRITEKEYWGRLYARGAGAAIGTGLVTAAVYAPPALGALNNFALAHFAILRIVMALGGAATGAPTVQNLQRAAQSGGATIQVVTNLTQAPQAGRSLSAAAGEGADALAAAARNGDGVKTFVADIPQALLNGLEQAGMLRISTTEMNGVQATEYQFSAAAMDFILGFFREKPPTQ
jgi:RHS repeat-associated protein